MRCGSQKHSPVLLPPYLYASPILLFNHLHFKVTKIATCRTGACDSVKKGPTKWIGHAEGDSDRLTNVDRKHRRRSQCYSQSIWCIYYILWYNVLINRNNIFFMWFTGKVRSAAQEPQSFKSSSYSMSHSCLMYSNGVAREAIATIKGTVSAFGIELHPGDHVTTFPLLNEGLF